MQAIDALREVFTVALLPDRKLVSFEDQPLSAVPSGKDGMRCLLYYHFEDQLKKRYARAAWQHDVSRETPAGAVSVAAVRYLKGGIHMLGCCC